MWRYRGRWRKKYEDATKGIRRRKARKIKKEKDGGRYKRNKIK